MAFQPRIPWLSVAGLLLLQGVSLAGSLPTFPASGLDPRSLGRGGTVIAVPGLGETVLGNPACLMRTGGMSLGASFVRVEGSEGFYSLEAVDGRGGVRAAFLYLTEPLYTGFSGKVWGAALSQTLGSSIVLGQSIRSGRIPDAGGEKTLSCGDLGVTVSPMGRVMVGYVARGFYRSDKERMTRRDGYGVMIALPWTLSLSADYEESASVEGKKDLRVGVEGSPLKGLTVRGGYQKPAGAGIADPGFYTMGVTYRDAAGGTLDGGMSWNKEEKKMERVVFGLTIRM